MGRLNAGFDALLRVLAWTAAAIFAAVAILIPVNVVLRNGFGTSIYGLLDAIEYGLLAATFLGAPWVLAINGHVTVDLMVSALGGRARRAVETLANLAGAAVTAVFLWYALEALAQSAGRGTMIRTAFIIPEWWVLSAAPVSMALILVEFLRKLVGQGAPAPQEKAGL